MTATNIYGQFIKENASAIGEDHVDYETMEDCLNFHSEDYCQGWFDALEYKEINTQQPTQDNQNTY